MRAMIESLKWTRAPKNYCILQDRIEITTEPHTDLWQRTYYHFRNDNAPVLQMETENQFFSFIVRTDFTQSHHRFDQCGIVMYLDSENWLKGSVEYTDEKPGERDKDIFFRSDEIFHVPGLGFNGLVGFSPIAMMKNSLGTTLAVEKYGSAFFKNGAQPSGVLEHPGVLKNPEKIRENWSDVYGGANNAHKVAVLEEGMSYKAISLPPEDSQFLSTRQFGVNEICRIFRVPPHLVQDLEHATFSNIEHQSIDFVVHIAGREKNGWWSRRRRKSSGSFSASTLQGSPTNPSQRNWTKWA